MGAAWGVVLLLLAAGLLVGGAELFAEHLSSAASRLGLTVLAVGVLLAGAEPEEAVTAMIASTVSPSLDAAEDRCSRWACCSLGPSPRRQSPR